MCWLAIPFSTAEGAFKLIIRIHICQVNLSNFKFETTIIAQFWASLSQNFTYRVLICGTFLFLCRMVTWAKLQLSFGQHANFKSSAQFRPNTPTLSLAHYFHWQCEFLCFFAHYFEWWCTAFIFVVAWGYNSAPLSPMHLFCVSSHAPSSVFSELFFWRHLNYPFQGCPLLFLSLGAESNLIVVFSAAGIFSISPNNFPLLVRLLSTWIQFSTYVRPLSACTDETVEVNFTSQMILLQVYVEDLNSHAALSTQLSTLEMFVDRTIVSHDIVIDFNFICGPFIHISILFQLQCIFFRQMSSFEESLFAQITFDARNTIFIFGSRSRVCGTSMSPSFPEELRPTGRQLKLLLSCVQTA